MEILNNSQEHINCPCYNKDPKQTLELKIMKKASVCKNQSSLSKIAFVLEGEVNYQHDESNQVKVQANDMLLIPPGKYIEAHVLKEAKLLVIQLREIVPFCNSYLMEDLLAQSEDLSIDQSIQISKAPYTLRSNEAIQAFVHALTLSISSEIHCTYYLDLKVRELFYLLKTYYNIRDLALFFKDILSPDSSFYYQVKQTYRSYNTVADFAASFNMTPHYFEKQFKLVFNTTPYQWMTQKRSKAIFQALRNDKTPLKELADRFGFASKSSFSDFVKKNLGETPGKIRKNCHI